MIKEGDWMKQKVSKKAIAGIILLFCANVIFFLAVWLLKKYDNVCFDQFLYQIKSSARGADNSLVLSGFLYMGGFGSILTALEVGFYYLLFYKVFKKIKFLALKSAVPVAVICLLASCVFFCFKLGAVSYIITTNSKSDFFEENYVKPESVKLNFPKNKRNLIFIFAESIESTYASKEEGGQFEQNFIPELCFLAEQNINFSNTKGLGGITMYDGTSWTAAGMFSATSGLTVKVPVFTNAYARSENFMPGVYTVGDILEKNGYNQVILMGSDAGFANRDLYFKQHGNYKIVDINSVKKDGKLPSSYKQWWGFEDKKLFEYAKEEITELSKKDEPFNLTLLTADTHFPNGYLCEDCQDDYDSQYSNVLRCSSKKINEFVEWIKKQDFYDNTTIIIMGDHLTMDPEFMNNVEKGYNRTIYNCIINSAIPSENEKERQFATFDLMPTTLASLGVEIEGERLGLGTNLFSDKKTITEKYGYDYSNRELAKKSEFYNKKILKMN